MSYMVPGGGAYSNPVLILNKLLIFKGAQNCQNAGMSRVEYATSTRDVRRMGFVFGRFDPSRDFLVGSFANEIFYKVIWTTRSTS